MMQTRRTPTWLLGAISVLFGLLYAYAVWAGLGNLLTVNTFGAEVLGATLTPVAWISLIVSMVIPIALFAIILRYGTRRAAWELVVLYVVGLALVGVYWINLQGLFTHPATVFQ